MNPVVIIQARLGSSRFPRKALEPIATSDGATLPSIAHTVRRVVSLGYPVIAAIPKRDGDELGEVMLHAGCQAVFLGGEDDVLTRVRNAAQGYDVIMRVTGDCPLWAPEAGRDVIGTFLRSRPDYVSNDTTCSGWPDGTDVEMFTSDALEDAYDKAYSDHDREHVTPWIRDMYPALICHRREAYPDLKLSVDTADDLQQVRNIMSLMDAGDFSFSHTIAACKDAGVL